VADEDTPPIDDPNPTPDTKPDDAASELQKKYAQEAAQSKKYRQRAQEAETEAKELRGRALSEEDFTRFKELTKAQEDADRQQAEDAGEFDKLRKQDQENHKAALAAKDAQSESYRAAFEAVAVTQRLQSALAAKGVTDVNAAAHLIQNLHEQRAVAELVDGSPVVKVVERGNGQTVLDPDNDGLASISIDTLVAAWLGTTTGQAFLPASGDTGSGSHKGGTDNRMTREKLDAMSGEETAAWMREHPDDYQSILQHERAERRKGQGSS